MKVVKKASTNVISYVKNEIKNGKCKHCILSPGPTGCHCN